MNKNQFLPDIQDGFIINDLKNNNNPSRCVFMTDIQGAIYDGNITYALAHECRGENVNVPDGINLLKEKSYEFITLLKITNQKVTVEGFRLAYFFNMNPFLPYSSPANKYKTMELHSHYEDTNSKLVAPLRRIEYLGFEELLDCLRSGKISVQNVFIKYTLNRNNEKPYTLLAPSRYVNFPFGKLEINNYIQPISGPVPIFYNDKIQLGYVVCLVRNGVVTKIECALNEELDLIKALSYSPFFVPKNGSLIQRIKPLIKWVYSLLLYPLRNIYHCFGYTQVIKLTGDCQFYRYV